MKKIVGSTILGLLLWTGVMVQDQPYIRNMLPGYHTGQVYTFEAVANSSIVNRNDSKILPEAYEKIVGTKVPLLLEHSWTHGAIVGSVEVVGTDGFSLLIHAEFTVSEDNKEELRKVVEGYSRFLSIGFMATPINKVTPIGNTGLGYMEKPIIFDTIDLAETSLVAVPADSTASISEVKKRDWGLWTDIRRFLIITAKKLRGNYEGN